MVNNKKPLYAKKRKIDIKVYRPNLFTEWTFLALYRSKLENSDDLWEKRKINLQLGESKKRLLSIFSEANFVANLILK